MAPRVFKALLRFIYTDSVPGEELAADHGDKFFITWDLLKAADHFGLERLKLICSDMLCGHIDALSAAITLKLAHRHGCLELKQACIKFLGTCWIPSTRKRPIKIPMYLQVIRPSVTVSSLSKLQVACAY